MTSASTPTSTSTSPRPARPGRPVAGRVGLGSFGPLILSASVAAALSRLIAHGMGTRVLLPLLVGIVIADVVTALAMRLTVNVFLAVALGSVVSLCGLLLFVDPSLFDPASPHFLHSGTFSSQLSAARSALAHDGTPLPLLSGLVVVVGAIGGGAAALTRGIWARRRRRHSLSASRGPLSPCLAPSVAIFVYSTLVSAEQGRVAAFVSYFLGVLAFVALADRTASPATSPATTPVPRARRPRLATGALAGCLLMALVVIAAGAGLSGMRLTVFHVTPPEASSTAGQALSGQGVPQDLITGIALVDHLLATEISESNVVIFRAQSPVTTYWQVGTLSSFDGTEWLPTSGVSGALTGSAGAVAASLSPQVLPSPSPAQTFTAAVAITDFASRLLPAPPGTIAVHGLVGATAIDEEGVLASTASTRGTTYTVTAGLDGAIRTGGRQLASSDPRLAPYLALPAQPPVVVQLARQAVGSAATPAAKAQALVNWFRSGRFRYTLSPPPTSGPDPLVQFLTVSKAGFCQQFAGAYGVLARALGIPTRLVVGFTAGQSGPDGSFTVTGADAHVWPQVYLGPDAGWVSVEPTPPSVAGTPAAEGVLGASGAPRSQAGGETGTPTSAPPQTVPSATAPSPHPAGSTGTRRGSRHHATPHHGGSTWWVLAIVLLGLLLLLASLAVWALRRRRTAYEAGLHPDQRVVRAWEHALGALRMKGLSRRVEETPGEYAARVRSVEQTSAPSVEADAVARLAVLVELACYTPRPCTPGQAAQAQLLASTIVAANRSHRRNQRRRSQPTRMS